MAATEFEDVKGFLPMEEAEKLRQEAILIIQPVVEAKPENLALGKALETLRGIVVANP